MYLLSQKICTQRKQQPSLDNTLCIGKTVIDSDRSNRRECMCMCVCVCVGGGGGMGGRGSGWGWSRGQNTQLCKERTICAPKHVS